MKTLEQILLKRLEVISNQELRENEPELQLKQLQSVSVELEQWIAENGERSPAKLRHFLANYSLQKALEFVQNEGSIERCGR